ncbi:MAG: SpoIID/LytB domain-containing protein [Lachnospiraceae bacterium]|nr:SpoIID/LytB domain-containing protein [Lachnospiraceae bacterium]
MADRKGRKMLYEKRQTEKWKERLFVLITSLLLPCILTLLISGTNETAGNQVSGIMIELENGNKVDMEEFLLYMLAGQIRLDAHTEALKAQCVIARTNLLRELAGEKEKKAKELNVAYLSPEKLENSLGGLKKEEILKKLKRVINHTYPYVLTYEEEYIEALYHHVSTGTTVSAEEIYGQGRPYLIAVDSSQDVEAEEYMTLSFWTGRELLAKLQGIGIGKEYTTDTIFSALKIAEKTKNGYVKKVAVGTEEITGEEWKSLFGLNSTHFFLEEQDGMLRMIVLGKGHGIGLSQYGAERMAEEGAGWKEILLKYYPGVRIEK